MCFLKTHILQRISLILLDEFARVCKENNIKWFVDSGTLLGAIRHGGFIPWDDDVDVVVPREDYNRLIDIGSNIFKHPFQLVHQSFCATDNFSISLKYCDSAKITRNSITPYYRNTNGIFLQNLGIGIDVEPLDYVPSNREALKSTSNFVRNLYDNNLIDHLFCDQDTRHQIQIKRKDAVDVYDSMMTRMDISNKNSGRVACPTWWIFRGLEEYFVSADCYRSYIDFEFTGCREMVRVPIGYEEILKTYYGDWKKETPRSTDGKYKITIVDDEHSFRDYEKFSNEELKKMIDMGVSMN